jgi:hypothetical protein
MGRVDQVWDQVKALTVRHGPAPAFKSHDESVEFSEWLLYALEDKRILRR